MPVCLRSGAARHDGENKVEAVILCTWHVEIYAWYSTYEDSLVELPT